MINLEDKEFTNITKILLEVLKKDSDATLKDLKVMLELDFIKNKLDKIKISDIYKVKSNNNDENINNINKTNIPNCIYKEDKENIKHIILNFMECNIEYDFNDIKKYVDINFREYNIKKSSLLGFLINMKNNNYVIFKKISGHKNGKWIKENLINIKDR